MTVRELYHESLLYRFLHWLSGLLHKLPESRIWEHLRSSAFSEKFLIRLEHTGKLEQSFCYRLGEKCNAGLQKLGMAFRRLWANSRVSGIVCRIREKNRQSLLFGWAARRGSPALLLGCLAVFPWLESLFKFGFQIDWLNNCWSEVILVCGILAVLRQRIFAKEPQRPRLTPAMLPILQFPLIGIILLCSVMLFPQIGHAGFYVTMGGLLWFWVITRVLRDSEDVVFLCRVMVLVAAFTALIGVLEYVFAIPMPGPWLETAETEIRTRAFAVFANPNQLGEYLELMTPMTVGMIFLTTDKKQKIFYGGCVLLMLAAGLFTMSRGAWIALAAAFFVFALLEDRRLLLLFFVAGVIALAIPFVSSRLTFLFSNDYIYSAAKGGRVLRWQTAFRYLRQGNPWLGLGFGMYGGEVANNTTAISDWTYYWVDNYYVKLLAENGVIGLISFFVMQAGVLFVGLRAWARVRRTRFRQLAAGLLAGMVAILVHGLFECVFDVKFINVLYWVCAGTMIWLGFLQKSSSPEKETELAAVS